MPRFETIDAYLAAQPAAVREVLERLRAILHELAPGSEEAFNYGLPTLKRAGKNLIHFAASKEHLAIYPSSGTVVATLGKALAGLTVSKGTIKFPLAAPLDVPLLKKIVKARAAEIDAAAPKKKPAAKKTPTRRKSR